MANVRRHRSGCCCGRVAKGACARPCATSRRYSTVGRELPCCRPGTRSPAASRLRLSLRPSCSGVCGAGACADFVVAAAFCGTRAGAFHRIYTGIVQRKRIIFGSRGTHSPPLAPVIGAAGERASSGRGCGAAWLDFIVRAVIQGRRRHARRASKVPHTRHDSFVRAVCSFVLARYPPRL